MARAARSRASLLALLVAATALLTAAQAQAVVLTQWHGSARPPGYRLTADQALAVATTAPQYARAAHRYGRLTGTASSYAGRRWEVDFQARGARRLEVHVDDRRARVVAAWTGQKLAWRFARGSKALHDEGETGALTNATWLWVLLVVICAAPFVDPKRPFRLLHLDLAVLLGFAVSHIALDHGRLELSLWLALPLLSYVVVRFALHAFRGQRGDPGPLVPYAPAWLLAAGLVMLVAARIVFNLVDSAVGDIAYAGVAGADRIAHGLDLYARGGAQYDTYGPVNYLLYWPFERVWPLRGFGDPDLWAAHAASIAFDLLTGAALAFLGTRLRAGRDGRLLGLALAYAWFAFPYSWYALSLNTNDAAVPMLLVPAVATIGVPVVSGALLGLASATKFAPAVVGPLLAGQASRRFGFRTGAVLALAAGAVALAAVVLYLPDGGFREFYDTTIGFQLGRQTPFSLWELHPSLTWIQVLLKVALGLLAVSWLRWPGRLGLARICAAAAATLALLQLTLSYWVEPYIVWFAPFAFAAAFAYASEGDPRVSEGDPRVPLRVSG